MEIVSDRIPGLFRILKSAELWRIETKNCMNKKNDVDIYYYKRIQKGSSLQNDIEEEQNCLDNTNIFSQVILQLDYKIFAIDNNSG